ncbi:hypothetical protein P3T76_015939 [Phytophthora citrophthora]|uniref:Uncharacterized protein n=1 Tax=Phytophthora citrophthora TaxID=4793 RepID=A0AAD9FYG4_9STRA|nr:hypothetical protein P3T76_015939 [Phytophthora citrophthora]
MSERLESFAWTLPQYVDLSRWGFAIWWTILLLIHLVTGIYNAAFALLYHELKDTYLYLCLDYSGIGMRANDHKVISLVNAVMAIIHGGFVLLMVGGSLWRQELVFSPWRKDKSKSNKISKLDSADKTKSKGPPKSKLTRAYSRVLGRRGLIGVNGNNFHVILLARELVETALQTVQAYRMSWLLPRMLLNRFYLSLIVLNCWSSVLVYSLLFTHNEARKRFAYLVCDCVLNLVSCIGVPLIIVLTYIGDYDYQLTGFPVEFWYDDEWSAHVLNEFQMIVVVSWMDLASRTIFSIGVISTVNNLKDLVRKASGPNLRRVACDSEPASITGNSETTPKISSKSTPEQRESWRARVGHTALRGVYGIFALWGLVVIGLHIQASVQPEQPQCVLQVHPWAVSNPACYLAVLDCHRFSISGKKSEVESKWNEFDRSTVVTLVIRHCPALEVPDSIEDFHITTGIKVYNSTIIEWGESAAITNTNHPALIWFYFVRVNVTDGVLPEGILSADFPGNLYDLEFTYTNVRELPEDLDSKWLLGSTVYFEYSELTNCPLSLVRVEPYSISLTGSPINELPPELFEVADLWYMYMAATNLQEMPWNVTNPSLNLVYMIFADTNVSFFWPWVDEVVSGKPTPLHMGGSRYCSDVGKILSGEANTFSVPVLPEYSTLFMDPSKANWDFLSSAVNCEAGYAGTVYPIDFEDSISAIVKPLGPSSQYVDLGPWGFALWWFIILGVHLITFAYNTAYTMFYYALKDTYMYMTFEYFGIGMVAKDHNTIAVVNAAMAALHGGCILLMIIGSMWQRELAFSPWPEQSASYTSTRSRRGSAKPSVRTDKTTSRLMSAKFNTVRMYSKVWGRQGVLGVNGGNFHMILIARELLETALQTQQAYRMSWYLPRWLLNRFYLCLLVLNCWSSVFVYSLLFKKNEAHRRFACLLCDCILDLISCMGVPLIVVLSYVSQYNPQITGFDMERWYDESWSAHVLNEFQMVLVTSWSDLASRVVFSFGLVSTTTSLKELLRRSPSGTKRKIAFTADSVRIPDKPKRTEANGPTLDGIITTQQPHIPVKVGGGSYGEVGLRSRAGRTLLHLVHLLFAGWGVLVLGLHIQASLQPELAQCTLQVHPWAVSEPACYLAVLDCYRLGISGKRDEVVAKWSEFDRSSVVTLVIRHCTTLEVPDMIREFHQTSGIKIYNSTINEWSASAAITNTNHPDIGFLFLVRVNMTDGVLPSGLHDKDFPTKLYDIEMCHTNLKELPEDLDSIWMVGTMIYIEYSQLTSVPLSITNLNPYYLAVTGNPISELPPEIFEIPDMLYLGSALPRSVTNLSPILHLIFITDTNVSYFWPWIDLMVDTLVILMGGSTYCAELEKITSGEVDTFSVLPSPEYSVMLTDASEDNWGVLINTINCAISYAATFYPLAFEDANSQTEQRAFKPIQAHERVHFIGLLCARMLCPHREKLSKHWAVDGHGAVPKACLGATLRESALKISFGFCLLVTQPY